MDVALFFERTFPGEGQRKIFREELIRICSTFASSGLADPKFIPELTSGDKGKLWSCISEALIFKRIREIPFGDRSNTGSGPDFLLQNGNQKVWIEVVCPQPSGVPQDWLEFQPNNFSYVPHNEILLRWTSAIKTKAEVLIGSDVGGQKGYLHSGIVSKDDVYVIVVNGCQLRHGPFPALLGISQLPYAIEAVFPVGPYQLMIDKSTLKCVGEGHQERYSITNANLSPVNTYAFLDPRYKMVSAIWAVDFNAGTIIGNSEPSALIHNPAAVNALPLGFLPSDEEYVATPSDGDSFQLKQITNAG